ncbi:MAG: glycosyltransferase family 2 protein [Flavobacterium sp.]
MPFFSVIIPVYNKGRFVEKTMKSVLGQTFADFEIIIVNDGSTDNSESKILGFDDARIRYFSKNNEGVSATRNFGIEKATADFICFLDADDYWYPDFLETMHHYILKLPEQKVFGSAYEIETAEKTFPALYSIKSSRDFEIVNYFEASKKESVLLTPNAAFHKEVFRTVGNFNVALQNLEDTDLWIRVGLKYPVAFIFKVLSRYVFDADGLSKSKKVVNTKIDFSAYETLEKTNPDLKLFLDMNRFPLAIKSKLVNDKKSFEKYYSGIDLKNFPLKKRILLSLPGFALRLLISLQLKLVNMGLGSSAFR